MQKFLVASLCLSADAFQLAPAGPRHNNRAVAPEMVLGYKLAAVGATAAVGGVVVATKKFLPKKKESADVTSFRSSLAGMESLSGLAELKIEREEVEGRKAGVWKEYVKADGRKWYYNTETKIQTWKVPDEIKKLDEVAAAAAAASGTITPRPRSRRG